MAKRKIIVTSSFKRDIKRRYLELVTAEWAEVLDCLVANNPLPEKYFPLCFSDESYDWEISKQCSFCSK